MALKYNLSGVSIIFIRLALAAFYLYNVIRFRVDVWTEPSFVVHMVLCVMEMLSTASLLAFPKLTTEGNGYLRCLPFLFISLSASLSSFFVPLGLLEDRIDYVHFKVPEAERTPLVTSAFIVSLVMYGGVASPLKLSWMQIFKPFVADEIEVPPSVKNRRRSTKPTIS